jgi:hypothetical protein
MPWNGIRRRCVCAAIWLACVTALAPAAEADSNGFGPPPPRNPYTAVDGAATMHADSASSGVSPWPGPGLGSYAVRVNTLLAACPTIVQGDDGMPVALCTKIVGQAPIVYLLDPATGAPLASMALPASGNLFGGVYTYVDQDNRLVLFDADGDLLRIGHRRTSSGWALTVDSSTPAGPAIDRLCAQMCGGVVGIAPDWLGRVWYATTDGVVGFVDPDGEVTAIRLGAGEKVANSISTVPGGTAIATDHALYLLDVVRGRPHVIWRYAYDRGASRKPGQLSWGTGATPVFFGPQDGARYLAITDNAAPAEHLLVFDTWASRAKHRRRNPNGPSRQKERRHPTAPHRDAKPPAGHTIATRPRLICDTPVLTPGPSGTENAPVAAGDSVFVASTYGYPYPASPAGEPPPQPATAPFTGGITRVDLDPAGRGCHVVWQDQVRSAAVPRLDAADGTLYTVQRTDLLDPTGTSDADTYSVVAIDAGDGWVLDSNPLGIGYESDTLQLSPTIVPGGVMYQGTITGIDRIAR